ncbi:MAG: penicillin-binding protein 2 [Patescibacteria group bacterium]
MKVEEIFGEQQDIASKNVRSSYRNSEIDGELIYSKESVSLPKKSVGSHNASSLYFIILVCFLVIFGRLYSLQIVNGAEYRQRSENNRIKIETVKALRGLIYDRNNDALVTNSPQFTLYFIPSELSDKPENLLAAAQTLSNIIDEPSTFVEEKFNEASRTSSLPVIIKDYLNYEQALKLKLILNNYDFLNLQTLAVRQYVTDVSFSHVLGYMGKISENELNSLSGYSSLDYIGKTGLENYYESELRGTDGKQQIERDSFNRSRQVIASKEPIPGENIILNIDAGLQSVLYQALKSSARNNNAKAAAAVAINPQNGQILALVSYPSYDNNLFFKGLDPQSYKDIFDNPNQPLIDRAISGEYPSGSTIKPTIAAAALQEKIITPETTVVSTGGIAVDKWFFPDWKAGGHGVTSVVRALAESVNTFFYALAGGYQNITGLGVDRLVSYFKLFGLGEKLGIDLPGESSGFLPSKQWKETTKNESWYIGDTYHLGIGQGDILVTPLQVASYTSVIANGGRLYQPQVVGKFTDIENKVIKEVSPKIIRQDFISQANLQVVKNGMREAVISGSARAIAGVPVTVAAKTGTAQYAADKRTHAWFTCFAPFENPEIVISVILEAGGEGNIAALPVAREALQWYFSR